MYEDVVQIAAAYIPLDRRRALAAGSALPASAWGAVLFADISGFTPLTERCVQAYGPQRGAEETTRRLNQVYALLIEALHDHGGSVVAFSGDGVMCWFESRSPNPQGDLAPTAYQALACGQRLQQALQRIACMEIGDSKIELGLKVAVATGQVQRMAVGDPALHLMDVIAGPPVDAVGWLEPEAEPGDVVLDASTAHLLVNSIEVTWRNRSADPPSQDDPRPAPAFATLRRLHAPPAEFADRTLDPSETIILTREHVRPWLAPAIYARLEARFEHFLAEIRPAVALFLRFSEPINRQKNGIAATSLDRFIRWVQQVLQRYEGTLIQLTTGDKGSYLYAAFGAPAAHGNDIVRAVAAALALRRPPADLGFDPQVQLGVAQGPVRVGPYGSSRRRTYGVQGPAVNLAARLMMHAAPGEIILDAAVADGAQGLFYVESRGAVAIKGTREPQAVFMVSEQVAAEKRRFSQPNPTQLVGRTAELAQLLNLLDAAQSGRGALARIEAEPGLGKSRLLDAFAQAARAEPIFLAVATCQITTRDTAYAATRQIGRQLLGLDRPELEDDDARIAQVEALLQQINPALLPRMPLLSEALRLPIPDNELTRGLDPKSRREALLALTLEIIQQLAQLQPIIILAEDIHWLDEASAELLATLIRAGTTSLLIVATHRPPTPQTAALLTKIDELPNQTLIRLSELVDAELITLAVARLRAPLDELALDFLQAQAQGNPFFIEELLDSLRESGDLVLDEENEGPAQWRLAAPFVAQLQAADCLMPVGGGWRLKSQTSLSAAAIGLPDSIHGIVLARLDRLPDAVQLTVKTASVIGRDFELDVLQRAHPQRIDQAQLAAHLATLEARDFARIESAEPALVYRFKHNITQEVAYQTLLDRQRRQLHQTVGETLEALQPESVDRLALHFYYSDTDDTQLRAKSLHYLDAAAQQAKLDYANQIALNYLTRALTLERSWPRVRDKVELLHILGRREEEAQALSALDQEAVTRAEVRPEAEIRQIETKLLWSGYYDAVSDYAGARAVVAEALESSRVRGIWRAAARCHAQLGLIAWRLGDYADAKRHYADGLAALDTTEAATVADAQQEEAEIRYGLGLVLRQQGQYAAAIEQFEHSLDLYQAAANRIGEARSLKALGLAEKYRQSFDAAQVYYAEALSIYRLVGARAGESETLLNIAEVHSLKGAHDLAKEQLGSALHIQQTLNNEWWQLRILNGLGIVDMSTGQHEQALAWLKQGLALAEKLDDESGQAYLLCNLGQTLTHLGRHAQAADALQRCCALAEAQADVNLQGLVQTELGMLALEQGNPGAARQAATAAVARFRELGLEAAVATDLATLALAHLQMEEPEAARATVAAFNAIPAADLAQSGDYPQRNYFVCSQVLQELGEDEQAAAMFVLAQRIMLERADKLAAPATRRAFLENIAYNRAIRATRL